MTMRDVTVIAETVPRLRMTLGEVELRANGEDWAFDVMTTMMMMMITQELIRFTVTEKSWLVARSDDHDNDNDDDDNDDDDVDDNDCHAPSRQLDVKAAPCTSQWSS